MKCRVCGNDAQLSGTYRKSAVEVSRFFTETTRTEGVDISLYGCPVCDHFQIPDVNPEAYYEDYVMTVSHSPKIQRLQAEQAKMLSVLAANHDHFVEIGCGDGAFLACAAGYFRNAKGIEPSRPYCELARKRNLDVVNDYLTENLRFDLSFDAFAARQVFEHLPNPRQLLDIIYGLMAVGSVGLIEVPNAQKMIGENRYFDLFSDHLNYFTPLSLCTLARECGFQTVMLQESFNGDYLEIYLRKKDNVITMEAKRESDLVFLRDTSVRYRRVSAWGAGSKAQAILTALGDELLLRHFFDTDHHKLGRYVVNCSTPISLPDRDTVRDNDLIVIFAASYQDEIIRSLRDDLGYSGDVLCFEGESPCIVSI